jgi:hypothetical protein
MSAGVLIFVFAGVSCGRSEAILAEFAPVPNAPSDVDSLRTPDAPAHADPAAESATRVRPDAQAAAPERGGPPGPEPTRFGDWERNGRCIDF